MLPRLVGQARALGLALTAEPLPAEKAEQWGLIWKAVDDATFLRELTRAFDARLGEVVSVSARASFPLRRVLARRLASGRLALAGDAALRAMWRRAAERGHDPGAPHRLARWERTRRSEAAVAAHAFETIDRAFSNDALLPTLLRGPVLGLAGRLPPLTRLLWQRAAGL